MFYRIENGNAAIFDDYGERMISIQTSVTDCVYPVGSDLSTNYEHPEGIVLSVVDAQYLGIAEEK